MTVVPTTTRDIYLPDEPDHPALADPEGIALVQAIHDRKAEGGEHARTNPAQTN
ncbi:hypothetical protein ACVWY0_003209 [Arthrobacter sp. UYNi723]